ncbi:MAG: 5,10-methenyltetrahydrofolate synthetase, partial [Nitrosopumilus sp.]|nr:5,10-methenyltetrahydrofolate synthetase [Nitrosopumilus sp.]
QVIQNIDQVEELYENLKGFSIIPILLYPSSKNEKSAQFLNLDLASYRKEFEGLLEKTQNITGDVLLTSPSDFNGLDKFLEKYTN